MSRAREGLLLLLAWLALTGSLAPKNLVTGLGAVLLVLWLGPRDRVGPSHPSRPALALVRSVPAALRLALFVAVELVRSSAELGREALTPRPPAHPGIVAVPLAARTRLETALVAALVSLTPGTLAVELERQGEVPVLYVHAVASASPEAVRERIRASYERRVLELLRAGPS